MTNKTCRLFVAVLMFWAGSAYADVPSLPGIVPVPASDKAPLSSAHRPGNEYADLDAAGYQEKEFYLHGVAPAINSNGDTLFELPYVTRILVRYPTGPEKFNGTVVIAPFGWISEFDTTWALNKNYLLRKGYAYVGYTINTNKPERDPKTEGWPPEATANFNLEFMRKFDYARYALLGMYFDPQRFRLGEGADPFVPQAQGIGAQLAYLLKSNTAISPLHGLDVQRVYADAWSIQAQLWMDYLNQGRHQQWRMPNGRPLIDAYMIGKLSSGEFGGDIARVPRHMPDDAPVVMVYSQSEVMIDVLKDIAPPPDSDQPRMRYYELTGVAHANSSDLGTGEAEDILDTGDNTNAACRFPYDDEPQGVLAAALLDGVDHWVREGKAMPRASRVVRQGQTLARDAKTNNLVGGVRPPWITVPTAAYMTGQESGCGESTDTKIPYSPAKLRALYGTHGNYVRQFEAAKQASIKAGYLLPEDAARVVPVAKPEDFVAGGDGAK